MKKNNRIFGKILMAVMIIFFYLPIVYMIIFSFNDGKSLTHFTGFSLRWYEHMLEFALPLYVKEGKSQLMIAVGCTGGKHRSITFARKIGEFCEKLGYAPSVQHRDVNRSL